MTQLTGLGSRFPAFSTVISNVPGPREKRYWNGCLLYTSDAADERSSVDLGGRRIIKKKNKVKIMSVHISESKKEARRTHCDE